MYWTAKRHLRGEKYINRIGGNELAARVKLNDLRHKEITPIENPTQKDYEWVERYKREFRQILEGFTGKRIVFVLQ